MSPRRFRWCAVATAAALLLAACDDGRDAPVTSARTTTTVATTQAKDLAGLVGTVPRVDMPAELRSRIDDLDSDLDADAPAAARPYDAAIVAVLAAEVARTDAPARIAANIEAITRDGQPCFDFESCRDLTDVGTDPDYNGPSGDIDLLGDGQSGDGTFAVMRVGATGALTQVSTESADVVPPDVRIPVPDPSSGPRADGRLVIGMVLPSSGPLDGVAAAARAGIRVAVAEVNADGGALGRPVQLVLGDAGDGSDAAIDTAAKVVLDAGADVVIGGLEGSETARLVNTVAGVGVVFMSVGVPSIVDTPPARSGFFFRLTPPVAVQARALAAAAADDGHTAAVVIHSADADGAAMLDAFTSGFSAVDASVSGAVPLGSDQGTSGVVELALALHPEALVIVADEARTASVLAELRTRGKGPAVLPTFVVNIGPSLLAAAS